MAEALTVEIPAEYAPATDAAGVFPRQDPADGAVHRRDPSDILGRRGTQHVLLDACCDCCPFSLWVTTVL